MIAQLVICLYGDARQVAGRGGDWGIDVMRGALNGKITIWQAKYFSSPVTTVQMNKQVLPSLRRALTQASVKGYTVEEWILCMPCLMTVNAARLWDAESPGISAAHDTRITVWDESVLRRKLAMPEAAPVRELFYNPYRSPVTSGGSTLRLRPVEPDVTRWRPGDRHMFGGSEMIIAGPVTELTGADGSWRLMRAGGVPLDDTAAGSVRLTGLPSSRPDSGAPDPIGVQADLLRAIAGRHGWPRLVRRQRSAVLDTLVTTTLVGPTWAEFFGVGHEPLDPVLVPLAAGVLRSVGDALTHLHRRGEAHRMIGPTTIVLTRGRRQGALLDLGLVGFARVLDEGLAELRAPEQTALAWGQVGPHTDVYQMAALFYRTCAGRPVSMGLPLRVGLPDFPEAADEMLMGSLAHDPSQRPSVAALVDALRAVQLGYHPGGSP